MWGTRPPKVRLKGFNWKSYSTSDIFESNLAHLQAVNDEIGIFLTILFMLLESLREDKKLSSDLGKVEDITSLGCKQFVLIPCTCRKPRSTPSSLSLWVNITAKGKEPKDVSCEEGEAWKMSLRFITHISLIRWCSAFTCCMENYAYLFWRP